MDEWREKEKRNQFAKTPANDQTDEKGICLSLASALE